MTTNITLPRAVVEQALEAWDNGDIECFKRSYTVMENLRAALAQQAEQKEKPWRCACGANLYIDENGAPRSKA